MLMILLLFIVLAQSLLIDLSLILWIDSSMIHGPLYALLLRFIATLYALRFTLHASRFPPHASCLSLQPDTRDQRPDTRYQIQSAGTANAAKTQPNKASMATKAGQAWKANTLNSVRVHPIF